MFFCAVKICEDFGHCTHGNRLHKDFINIAFFKNPMSLIILLKYVFHYDWL